MPQLHPGTSPAEAGRVWVLCDGMGGHGHGEVASELVARSVYKRLAALPLNEDIDRQDIQQASDMANEELAAADVFHDSRPMGTTLVVAVLNSNGILVAHAGDSRCYLIGADGKIKFRSADHSVVGQALAAGILTEEEAFTSSRRNEITRCLTSVSSAVPLDFTELTDIEPDDILLMCSDGVHDVLRDLEISTLLSGTTSCEEKAAALEKAVMKSPVDNTSAILLSPVFSGGHVGKSRRPLMVAVLTLAVLAGAAGFFYMTRSMSPEKQLPLPVTPARLPDSAAVDSARADTITGVAPKLTDTIQNTDS